MAKLTNCLNPSCGKELEHTEGRRPKKYCTPKCRISHHIQQKKQPKFVRIETHNKLKEQLRELMAKEGEVKVIQMTEKSYDGNQVDRSYVGDKVPIMNTPDPKINHDIRVKLLEYEAELPTVPDIGSGKLRRKWLQNKIYELKQQLK